MLDFIIVGSGLAGIAFAEQLINNQKQFVVIDFSLTQSTNVAAGLYNPVVLKRFTEVNNAKTQLQEMTFFYERLQNKLNQNFDNKSIILRRFSSIEEQNNWYVASDKPNLNEFLVTPIFNEKINFIKSPFGFGKVKECGFVDTNNLKKQFIKFLEENHLFHNAIFDFSKLKIKNESIEYNGIYSKNIVFCEGYNMLKNPFFNQLPLDGTKGEVLIIKAELLKLKSIIKSSIFILPLGNKFYKVGATYNWQDKTEIPTKEGKDELLFQLNELLSCDYEVVKHQAGIRPTVKDRRPLVGTHPKITSMHILNGLGTRGVLLAPYLAKCLFEKIEYNIPLEKEISIDRFKKIIW